MTDRHEQLHAYEHLRDHLTALQTELTGRLPRRVLKEARRKLRLDRVRAIDEMEETVSVVLVDYALHHYRPGGRTLFEAYFEEHPPEPGSHEDRLRQALATYRYTIVEVGAAEEGVGVEAYDVLARRPFFLMDRSLSRSPGGWHLLAAGMLWMPEYAMTTGAALPLSGEAFDRVERELTLRFGALDALEVEALRPAERAGMAAAVIQHALREDGAGRVSYR